MEDETREVATTTYAYERWTRSVMVGAVTMVAMTTVPASVEPVTVVSDAPVRAELGLAESSPRLEALEVVQPLGQPPP